MSREVLLSMGYEQLPPWLASAIIDAEAYADARCPACGHHHGMAVRCFWNGASYRGLITCPVCYWSDEI